MTAVAEAPQSGTEALSSPQSAVIGIIAGEGVQIGVLLDANAPVSVMVDPLLKVDQRPTAGTGPLGAGSQAARPVGTVPGRRHAAAGHPVAHRAGRLRRRPAVAAVRRRHRAPLAGHRAHLDGRLGQPQQAVLLDQPVGGHPGRLGDGRIRRPAGLAAAGLVPLQARVLGSRAVRLRDRGAGVHRRPADPEPRAHPAEPSRRRHAAVERHRAGCDRRRVRSSRTGRLAPRGDGLCGHHRRGNDDHAVHRPSPGCRYGGRHGVADRDHREPVPDGLRHRRGNAADHHPAGLRVRLPQRTGDVSLVVRYPVAGLPVGDQPLGVRGPARPAHHRHARR